jgi:uncharacterized protein YcbX
MPDNDQSFPEQALLGKTLSVGSAQLKIEMTCPRCSMTTHGFDDLPRDTEIMRKLVNHCDGNLGIYASVQTPGRISIEDHIEISEN